MNTDQPISWRSHVVLFLAIAALSCTADGPPTSDAVQYDSAGLKIVENASPAPASDGAWRVAPEPSLVIGSVQGDPSYQFFGIAGAHRMADGRVAVVDAGSFEVRIFDANGTFLQAYGRRGAGPEEFGMPALAGTISDTLVIVDRAHHRLTFLHPDAGFVRLARVDDEVGGFLNPSGMFRNGHAVFGGAFDMRRIGDLKEGMNRAHTFYRSCDPDGSAVADFGDKQGAEFYIGSLEGSGPDSRPSLIPFGKTPLATVTPDRFYFAEGGTYEIEVYESSGGLVGLIRLEHRAVPIQRQHVDQYVDMVAANAPDADMARAMRQHLLRLPVPDAFPAIGALQGDNMGYLWVADYTPPNEPKSTWNIFDPAGVLAGRVSLPSRVYPLEIGRDYLLGTYRDEDGVEYLHLYPVARPS